MFQFPTFAPQRLCIQRWVPLRVRCRIQRSTDRSLVTGSLWLIAGSHVFHRLWTPRHPPCALSGLIASTKRRSTRPLRAASPVIDRHGDHRATRTFRSGFARIIVLADSCARSRLSNSLHFDTVLRRGVPGARHVGSHHRNQTRGSPRLPDQSAARRAKAQRPPTRHRRRHPSVSGCQRALPLLGLESRDLSTPSRPKAARNRVNHAVEQACP